MPQHYTHIGIETAKNAVALLPDVTKEPGPVGTESAPGPVAMAAADVAALTAMLTNMTAKTWKSDRDKLLELLGAGKGAAVGGDRT